MVCILCQKKVKIIDSDISVDTVWCPKYLYVISKRIALLENVTLRIADGTKVFLLNGFDEESFSYIASFLLKKGSKLLSKEWTLGAADLVNGYYVVSELNENGGLFVQGSDYVDPSAPAAVSESEEEPKICKKTLEACCCNNNYTGTYYRIDKLNLRYTYMYLSALNKNDTKINEITGYNIFTIYLANGSELELNRLHTDGSDKEVEFYYTKYVFHLLNTKPCSVFIKDSFYSRTMARLVYSDRNSDLAKITFGKCSDLDVIFSRLAGVLSNMGTRYNPTITANDYLPSVYAQPWNYIGKIKCPITIGFVKSE